MSNINLEAEGSINEVVDDSLIMSSSILESEIETLLGNDKQLLSMYDLHEYSEMIRYSRELAYGELNQFELQYNDLINNTTTWKDAITAVKVTYPKPTN
jgi:hypothetical protein